MSSHPLAGREYLAHVRSFGKINNLNIFVKFLDIYENIDYTFCNINDLFSDPECYLDKGGDYC